MAEPTSPLLRLPFEIRLMVYEYLLFPSATPSSSHSTSVANLLPDFHTYHSSDTNDTPFTLAVRTIDPYAGVNSSRGWRLRSTYHVRTGPFLTTTTPTTYRVLLSPYTAHLRHTVPSLLSLSHQIHAEAAKVLYANYTFSFHTSIEAAVPFFSDLTPIARDSVRHVALTKKGLPYTKEFDRLEWGALCGYLAREVCLSHLYLSVVAGKPGDNGWDSVAPISKEAFALMQRMKNDWGSSVGGADLTWVDQLFEVRGFREVSVKALVEHCPPAVSETMAFWIAFSKSVEGGFGEWVRGVMVGGETR
ncbi:uncharacterized protein CC84DRAFT_553346 [Paraphaeosphaeria sporulosa]|uniref:Uncharacterized protein n=1 Tax=Paraphaeosphaeria sporulosa TaxID=1460663 RepID=A0A177CMC9_9PLEO|nr:uncharacterized protein CC84DRAFT_553346 [Paraphaeosphaeria sporulosa]OAG08102.1 hypothetical protein CC84DRAFT_553346 [Paraphaeosphaeria sporulosa]